MTHDLIIIGGGIIGITAAYEYQKRYPDDSVLVLEKEDRLAAHQTGRNSGVIHSGIYYKPGSLKATTCRRGIQLLIRFAEEHQIPYEICGKLIVATEEKELPGLEALFHRGTQNGLSGLRLLGPEEIREYEPEVRGLQAIVCPETGIIDYSTVVNQVGSLVERQGGKIMFHSRVRNILEDSDGVVVESESGEYRAGKVMNCAGLYSDRVAAFTNPELDIQLIPFRGEYYTIKPERRSLIRNPVYPVPDPRFPFLGVHYTRRINGEVEAGPNAVLALAREGYSKSDVDFGDLYSMLKYPGFWKMVKQHWQMGLAEQWRSLNKAAFVKSLQKLTPAISAADLTTGGAGVRAQAVFKNGRLLDDFHLIRNGRVLNVVNAPSPAATASFAIAERIVNQLGG